MQAAACGGGEQQNHAISLLAWDWEGASFHKPVLQRALSRASKSGR